jgi:hypothetical protein
MTRTIVYPPRPPQIVLLSMRQDKRDMFAGAILLDKDAYTLLSRPSISMIAVAPDRSSGLAPDGRSFDRSLVDSQILRDATNEVLRKGRLPTTKRAAHRVAAALKAQLGDGYQIHGPYPMVNGGAGKWLQGNTTIEQVKRSLGLESGPTISL